MRCLHRYLPSLLSDDCAGCARGRDAAAVSAPALNMTQALFASKPLPQTGRLMLKDEDLCVHCGLCAERCPTAAWDMQKFQLFISYAGIPGNTPIMRSRINDFAIKLANVNGTGSASANSLIMQAIFRMGVPVSGKNLFPSNIQGLPTWYEIRVNRSGYTARGARLRPDGGDECADLLARRGRTAAGWLSPLRFVVAARCRVVAGRH